MRYLCLNQTRPIQLQTETMSRNKSKRQIEDTFQMEINTASDIGLASTKKAKRFRSAFTTEQIQYLDAEFRKYPYIGSARRKEVSSALNISERAVKIWFQNRRMKEKKDTTSNETDSDEHKNSRKIDVANDQLNNECTVTSTNTRHYASLPLMSPKKQIPKNIDVALKQESEINKNDTLNQSNTSNTNQNSTSQPTEASIDLYKPYSNCLGQRNPLVENGSSNPTLVPSPKSEVTSTSIYDKLPQDLSRKRKPLIKPMRASQAPLGGYFPLNLKKYYAQSVPGGNMMWKPIQVLPMVSTGASVSISNSLAPGAVAPLAARAPKECHCECRCHPASPPAPVLLQQGSPNPLTQYVLTALPLQNPYYKY